MMADIDKEYGPGHWAGCDVTEGFLPDGEIQKLNRDLRILIASNGTLTRVLGIVANDDIVVQIVEQQVQDMASRMPDFEQLPSGRILRRRIFLNGRNSGHSFIAAESLVAIDLLPPAIMTSLIETERPIGEIMAASCLETFKETAKVWIGQPPDWLAVAGYESSEPRIVGRRYRIMIGAQPVIIITEYFLRNVFQDAS
jgi:chorismate--pyruvate lyase